MVSNIRILSGLFMSGAALAHCLPAGAQTVPPVPASAFAVASPSPVAATLRRFGDSRTALTFSGEMADASLPFFVTAEETSRPARLVLALSGAVSIAPETSNIQVFVNDVAVTSTTLGSDARLAVDLPPGLLQPGYNAVRFALTQHHRVDCSINATYELWSRIDPAASGIDFGLGTARLAGLGELPALGRTGGEPLLVRGVLPPNAGPEEIGTVMEAVQAAILLGGFNGAAVEFGEGPGTGSGLDVAVGTPADLAAAGLPAGASSPNTTVPGVALLQSAPGGRALLAVSSATAGDLSRTVSLLAAEVSKTSVAGTPAGLRAHDEQNGHSLGAGRAASLAELGFVTKEFAGRFFRDEVAFTLPADFYAADYADASLVLDAAYAAGLGSQARLLVRANGREVSSLSLSSARAGRISRQALRIPLGALKPGRNILSFEANLARESDAVCDPAAEANPAVRFALSDTSVLKMPYLARIGHLPDVAAFAGGGQHRGGDRDGLTVLVPGLDPAGLGAAASVLSRTALADGRTQKVRLVSALPVGETGDVLAAGTFASLPVSLTRAVRLDPVEGAEAATLGEDAPAQAGVLSIAANAATGSSNLLAAISDTADLKNELLAFVEPAARSFLDALGWSSDVFGDQPAGVAVKPGADTLVTLAQAPMAGSASTAWTVIAARSSEELEQGARSLVQPDVWPHIEGAATLLSRDGTVSTVAAQGERLFQTQPFSVQNSRYILAGWFSRHTENYLFAVMLLGLLLAATTRFFLRGIGKGGK